VRYKLFIPFALLNSFFILLMSALVAVILAWASGLHISTMLISAAPGGLAEMTILGQALGISVPMVVAFHLFRVIVINLGTPYIFLAGQWVITRLRAAAPD
ncbi:MAG: AbrB family transcriptional regulator, partial [Alphaproteobacteria bacterium]|nr:AbrB family transcriptional regulator [Alphaproteobacteria bacterium]